MAQRNFQWRLGIRRTIGVCAGLALAMGGLPAMGASMPQFLSGSLSGIHDGDGVYDANNPLSYDYGHSMPMYGGSAILLSPFASGGHPLSGVISTNAWSSSARAGASHIEGSNSAKVAFPAGMGIDQTDPGHVQSASALQVNFDYSWTITGPLSPIGSTFSIPIGASVSAGGSASFVTHVHWDITSGGNTYTDARARYYSPVTAFPVGVTATSFTAPAAPFTPGSLIDGDVLRIYGFMIFTADNDTGPTRIETLPGAFDQPPDQSTDPTFFNLWQSEHIKPDYPTDLAATFDANPINVPEPSGMMVLAIAAMGMVGGVVRALVE